MLKIRKLVASISFAVISLLFVLAPVLLVRQNLKHMAGNWQELALYALCIAGGGIAGAAGFNLGAGGIEIKRQRAIVWGGVIASFLYLACAVLCEKIHFGTIQGAWWKTTGVVVAAAGSVLRLWAILALGRFHSGLVTIQSGHELIRSGLYKHLRHPSYLGVLICLAGIPMIFGSWLPLLAMPGAFIALRWRMDDEEKLLANHFGEKFEQYKQSTWRLIPYIY